MSASPGNQFASSLRLFVDIAMLRRGPEDLPVSTSLLVTTVLAAVLLSLGLSSLMPQGSTPVAGPLLTDTVLTLLSLALLLHIARKPERFLQTATAMFGFHLLLAPLLILLEALIEKYAEVPSWQLLLMLVFIALGGWTLVVSARILHSATGWPVFMCVAMVLLQELAILGVVIALFPDVIAGSGSVPATPVA